MAISFGDLNAQAAQRLQRIWHQSFTAALVDHWTQRLDHQAIHSLLSKRNAGR
jgi:hypothetical protein